MSIHIINIPDLMRGRELRTIEWDDVAETVTGDHSAIHYIDSVLDSIKPVTIGAPFGTWDLHRPGHDPQEFLTMLQFVFPFVVYPDIEERVRAMLPPVFDGIRIPPPDRDTGEILIFEEVE